MLLSLYIFFKNIVEYIHEKYNNSFKLEYDHKSLQELHLYLIF